MLASARILGASAAALAAALTARALYLCGTSGIFACPGRLAKPRHYALQVLLHWRLRLDQWLLKPVDPAVVRMVEERVRTSGSVVEVYSKCTCGACCVSVTEGGPLFTTLCHCSMCRTFNFNLLHINSKLAKPCDH